MKLTFKKAMAAFGAVAVATTIMVAVPTTAQAALNCSGSHVRTLDMRNGNGTVVARLGVYRSGTKICAVGVKAGPMYGVGSYMQILLQRRGTAPGYWSGSSKHDLDYVKYQTNAITIDALTSSNRCIRIELSMDDRRGRALPEVETVVCA